jgi:hypothetical protein
MRTELPLLARLAGLTVLLSAVGCGVPRSKTYDAYHSAVTPNVPFRSDEDFKIDPYTFGGIADGSGGTSTKTKFGAGAPGPFNGATELYFLLTPEDMALREEFSHKDVFLVPDPELESYLEVYYASPYLKPPHAITEGAAAETSEAPAEH